MHAQPGTIGNTPDVSDSYEFVVTLRFPQKTSAVQSAAGRQDFSDAFALDIIDILSEDLSNIMVAGTLPEISARGRAL